MLKTDGSNASLASFTTGSYTPTSGGVTLVAVMIRTADLKDSTNENITISGNGLTWVKKQQVGYDSSTRSLFAFFTGTGTPSAGGLTFKYVDTNAGSFVTSDIYVIATTGTTDFTLIGAANSNPGTVFTATGAGSGSGTATRRGNAWNTAIAQATGQAATNPIVQSNATGQTGFASPVSTTLSAFASASNYTVMMDLTDNNSCTFTTTSGYTRIDVTSTDVNIVQYKTSQDTAPSIADNNCRTALVAFELAPSGVVIIPSPRLNVQSQLIINGQLIIQ